MAQEEADAVAALMAAASGDIRSEAAADADDQSPPGEDSKNFRYFTHTVTVSCVQ